MKQGGNYPQKKVCMIKEKNKIAFQMLLIYPESANGQGENMASFTHGPGEMALVAKSFQLKC